MAVNGFGLSAHALSAKIVSRRIGIRNKKLQEL